MLTTIRDSVFYLQTCSPLVGLTLLAFGSILALGGWRIRKGAMPASFGLVGVLAGIYLCKSSGQEWLYAAIGFVVMGVVGHLLGNRAPAVLGGMIGGGIANCLADSLALTVALVWLLTAIGVIAAVAMSFLHLRNVVIVITSFEGAALIVAAGVIFFSGVPWVANQFHGTSVGMLFVVGFTLLVPTVIGSMLQIADVTRSDGTIIGT